MEFCPEGWPILECDCEALDELDAEKQAATIELAAYILWGLTGKRFGTCEVTVKPCGDPLVRCGYCAETLYGVDLCCCRRPGEITLPGPIDEITEILIDGVAVDPTTYRVEDRHWLVRLDDAWPRCPDMIGAGFEITYTRGQPVPAGGGLIVAELACELAKAICRPSDCRLPKRMTQKTRQGVTVSYEDFSTTGIYLIDAWVSSVNSATGRARIHSLDLPPKPREITWEAGGSP